MDLQFVYAEKQLGLMRVSQKISFNISEVSELEV